MKYLITYDLCKPGQNYSGFRRQVDIIGSGVVLHPSESSLVIESPESALSIYARLSPFLDFNDKLIIAEIIPANCVDKKTFDPLLAYGLIH